MKLCHECWWKICKDDVDCAMGLADDTHIATAPGECEKCCEKTCVAEAAPSARLSTDSTARKDMPVFSGCLAYFPDALAEVSRLSMEGNRKHNPGQPLHWSRAKSNDHLDTIARHMLEAGELDSDGFYHDVKIAWRALANLQVLLEKARNLPPSRGSK